MNLLEFGRLKKNGLRTDGQSLLLRSVDASKKIGTNKISFNILHLQRQVMAKDYNPFRPFKNTDVLLKGRTAGQSDHAFPETELTGHKEYISYYQWIPIIISVQAFLFYAPHLMWLALASQSGTV